MELLNETFNEVYVDCDNDDDSYYTRLHHNSTEYIQLDMFKDYTMAIVLPRDEDDDYWFSDYCATVFIGTNRYSVEDKFTNVLQNHPTNVGRFLLIEQPLHKLYSKEW